MRDRTRLILAAICVVLGALLTCTTANAEVYPNSIEIPIARGATTDDVFERWAEFTAYEGEFLDLIHSALVKTPDGAIHVDIPRAPEYAQDFLMMVYTASNPKLPAEMKLGVVHQWVHNNIDYVLDADLYDQSEYFAGPIETLKRGAGDCEDRSNLISMTMRSFKGIEPEQIYMALGSVMIDGTVGGHAMGIIEIDDVFYTYDGNNLLTADDALRFYQPGLLYRYDGRAWRVFPQ